jgi:hypothetical protein
MTCTLLVIGIQAVFFGLFAKFVAVKKNLLPPDPLFKIVQQLLKLEKCLLGGGTLVIAGVTIACYGLFYWYRLSFGPVQGESLIRIVCAASVLMSVGFQLILSSFFVYLLDQQPAPPTSKDRCPPAYS